MVALDPFAALIFRPDVVFVTSENIFIERRAPEKELNIGSPSQFSTELSGAPVIITLSQGNRNGLPPLEWMNFRHGFFFALAERRKISLLSVEYVQRGLRAVPPGQQSCLE